jgi:hypothetical protein
MHKYFVCFTLLIVVCSFAVSAGGNPQKGKARADVGKTKEARGSNSAQCPSPRPKNRGCSVPCKPCQIAVCENGKWVFEKVDWPKEQCAPRRGQGGKVCTIGVSDPCPPECKSCVRK